MNRLTPLMAALAGAVLLAACGGSGSDDEVAAPITTVPASAQASAEAYTAFTAAQPEDDQREPLTLDGVVPPSGQLITSSLLDYAIPKAGFFPPFGCVYTSTRRSIKLTTQYSGTPASA